ncbi:MAG: T9SS type A sorting domain-containing protein, partial [Bacteroidia bacterium]|nr:T9SS type A sorting domain-containing protein [Bacteroidia bacterium]
PNYYLGPVTGSLCDTLGLGITEQSKHDFRFSILPNPNSGSFQILYLLPPDKSGVFSVYDINGRKVYEQKLPQWSTVQSINLMSGGRHAPVTLKGSNAPIADGIYQCVITSGNERVVKKVAIIKE